MTFLSKISPNNRFNRTLSLTVTRRKRAPIMRNVIRNMPKNLYNLTFAALLIGCSGGQAPKSTITVNTGHKNVTDALITYLEAKDTWYSIKDDTTVVMANPLPNDIIDFLNSEANKIIPEDRSASFSLELRNKIHQRLDASGINYHTVNYDNSIFTVWDNRDTDKVSSISEQVATEALDARLAK